MAKKGSNHGVGGVFKRFVGNKNTVTLLGLVACIAVLVIGYNYRVNTAISPVSVPYAKVAIDTRTLITSDMVGNIKISSSYLQNASNIVKTSSQVVGKYVSYKTSIPKGSLFYSNQLKEANQMPDSAFANIADGYTIYSLDVTSDTTYSNSIAAGDYIDLYMSAKDTTSGTSLIIYAELIQSIRVLAVKDSKGNNITSTSTSTNKPAELLFAVPDDVYLLLKETEYVKSEIKIEPVIRNSNYTKSAGSMKVSSEELKAFIEQYVTVLS
ncbi:MAG TPA: RcpC/CpaB family pilus assembly protein [Bacilli bacterium]|jgi:Flp pilus assembly protein CpaB|nr:RcpC/CpaB family pilus assembly protein [Bacilli bacterium]HQC83625.1 RcpC/CpaB family pilus assembly protein [Bacilli bacterium]